MKGLSLPEPSVHTGRAVITTAYSSRGFRRAGWDNPDNAEQAWGPWKWKCHIHLANDPRQPSALQPVTSLSASEDTWKDEVPRPSLTTQASLIRDWEEAQSEHCGLRAPPCPPLLPSRAPLACPQEGDRAPSSRTGCTDPRAWQEAPAWQALGFQGRGLIQRLRTDGLGDSLR